MGIRGFGNIFGEQQTGDVGNVGIDLFFEMLFESLSKVICLIPSIDLSFIIFTRFIIISSCPLSKNEFPVSLSHSQLYFVIFI